MWSILYMKLSLVSYLDEQSSAAVREIQQKLSDVTGSKASLAAWEPHVTIGDGVEVSEVQLEKLKNHVEPLAKRTAAFKLKLHGIGSLDNWQGGAGETPFVIYLDIILNENLVNIVNAVDLISNHYQKWYSMPRPYLPHSTLAFRDLDKEGYEKGLSYIERLNPDISALIDHIAVVEKLPNSDRELIRFNLQK